ncbi:nucleotidyltransferase domain-containing protein [Paenibacillus sp. CECT 9249]|uniref:type VII toxin-antitoxin system MntA family adenylyltransferase antitoxin n=1 Tax=Paenibacillus sp. CECT 9249 TaxID=2845385 RepID=UPI001E472780|nr:nucleotidyltransferase domain-containing protein [Paenibacillus sp. CECT 9249]
MLLDPSIRQHFMRTASEHRNVRRVFLFGSRAKGDADERSDIDLAVEAPEADEREWLEIMHQLEDFETLLAMDIIRLDEASSSLREVIYKEGQIVYEQPKGETKPDELRQRDHAVKGSD